MLHRQLSQHGQLETAATTQAGLLFSFGCTAASLSITHPAISTSFLPVLLRPEPPAPSLSGRKKSRGWLLSFMPLLRAWL